MCKECQKLICPPTCPSYWGFSPSGGAPRGRCSFCEEALYEGDEYYRLGKDKVCRACAEEMELDTLAAICRRM